MKKQAELVVFKLGVADFDPAQVYRSVSSLTWQQGITWQDDTLKIHEQRGVSKLGIISTISNSCFFFVSLIRSTWFGLEIRAGPDVKAWFHSK